MTYPDQHRMRWKVVAGVSVFTMIVLLFSLARRSREKCFDPASVITEIKPLNQLTTVRYRIQLVVGIKVSVRRAPLSEAVWDCAMLREWMDRLRAALSHKQPDRRKWSAEDRQRIVQASLKSGTTVEAVARVYGVNTSQIYDWRKQHRQAMQEGKAAALLPVHVTESVRVAMPEAKQDGSVVIEGRNTRVTFSGCLDVAVIRTVLEYLAQ